MSQATVYRVKVRGALGPQWAAWFGGLEIGAEPDGTTTITGPLTDQSVLHGLLARVRDLGLELVAVEAVGTEAPAPAPGQTEV
jgi:hypothetical protein